MNCRDEDGLTPLAAAARAGYRDLVEYLIAQGAEPKPDAADWATPLALADWRAHAEIAAVLRQHGAYAPRSGRRRPNERRNFARTPPSPHPSPPPGERAPEGRAFAWLRPRSRAFAPIASCRTKTGCPPFLSPILSPNRSLTGEPVELKSHEAICSKMSRPIRGVTTQLSSALMWDRLRSRPSSSIQPPGKFSRPLTNGTRRVKRRRCSIN